MGNLLEYSGIVTKVRAMEARLLKPEQFVEIANLSSVPEIADYLRKNTAYAAVLDTLTEDQIHRGNIEKVLTQSLIMITQNYTGSADKNSASLIDIRIV